MLLRFRFIFEDLGICSLVKGLEEIDVRKKYKRRGMFRNIPNWEKKKGVPFMNYGLLILIELIFIIKENKISNFINSTWNMLDGTSIQIIQSEQSRRVFC